MKRSGILLLTLLAVVSCGITRHAPSVKEVDAPVIPPLTDAAADAVCLLKERDKDALGRRRVLLVVEPPDLGVDALELLLLPAELHRELRELPEGFRAVRALGVHVHHAAGLGHILDLVGKLSEKILIICHVMIPPSL